MPLKVRCPTCQELFSTRPEMGGAEIVCPMCQARFELPAAPQETVAPSRNKPEASAAARAEPGAKPLAATAPKPRSAGAADQAEQMGVPSAVAFPKGRVISDDLDMTPMVDITFLLLIFFMVTAAFSLQKSYQVPTPDDSRRSTQAATLADLEDDPRYVIVRIDDYDTYHVGTAAWDEEQEAPSKPDLLDRLRQARSSGPQAATHMLVLASEKATHERVVAALDAGTEVGMEDVKLLTTPAEE